MSNKRCICRSSWCTDLINNSKWGHKFVHLPSNDDEREIWLRLLNVNNGDSRLNLKDPAVCLHHFQNEDISAENGTVNFRNIIYLQCKPSNKSCC